MEQQILEFLRSGAQSALAISKHIFGKNATKKMVNPTLYSMQKRNLVRIVHNETTISGVWWEIV